jgi:hypothetical protein
MSDGWYILYLEKNFASINKKFHLTLFPEAWRGKQRPRGRKALVVQDIFFIDFQLVGATRRVAPEKALLRQGSHSAPALL